MGDMLSDSQLHLVAETLANIGVVFFGSMVVPFFAGSGTSDALSFAGFIAAFASWIISIIILKYPTHDHS